MTLIQQLKDYIHAAFSGIWLMTLEPDEVQREIVHLCQSEGWQLHAWDVAQGCYGNGLSGGKQDPLFPLNAETQATKATDLTCLVVLHNFHRFLQNPVVMQTLFNRVIEGKGQRTFYVILSPVVQLPVELEKVFVVLEHDLPNKNDLMAIANEVECGEGTAKAPLTDQDWAPVLAASGLTRYEAEGSFALSLARHGRITPEEVWQLKASMLKKSGLLELHRGPEKFADLGGLEALKDFCRKALILPPGGPSRPAKPRGILLLGVPGTGKSAFAKALGNEIGRPTLLADPGSWKGSLVGETGQKTRQALKVADAMSPAVLFIDEIEKALAGATSQYQGDSGVSADQLGALLTWMNDHTSDVFVVATSNDISKLPPEFCRAERWDAVFFIDLPGALEQEAIWQMYQSFFGLAENKFLHGVTDDNWTGAEIRSCCRLAALLNIPLTEAAQYVVPVATTAADKVAALREWASGKCLSASKPGIYQKDQANNGQPRARRKVQAR